MAIDGVSPQEIKDSFNLEDNRDMVF